jgi:hypothetical protein
MPILVVSMIAEALDFYGVAFGRAGEVAFPTVEFDSDLPDSVF